jgi:beta-galactosidase
MTRGEFETDVQRNVITSYDDEHAPWGHSHREAWRLIAERPFLAGGFVWTGFDYRGEPQRLEWPSVSSVFGIMDTCGFPKTAYHIHQSEWIKDRPVLAIAPHWNWTGRDGQPVRVIVMTNGQSAELFLNGTSLGRKDRPAFDSIEWEVPYTPGRLEAVSYKDGREHARSIVETTGQPAAIHLTPDRTWLAGDGRDAMPVTVSVVDSEGRVVPGSDNEITFALSGPGANIGHGNGNHNSHECEHGPCRKVFHGLAQLIVQSRCGSGPLTIRAMSPGLRPAEVTLDVRAAAAPPAIPPAEPAFAIERWRAAPAQPGRPDPCMEMSDADMNTWSAVTPGTLLGSPAGHWVLLRAEFTPWRAIAARGGLIRFGCIHGTCEIWIDGAKVAEKPDAPPGAVEVNLAPASGPRSLSLLLRPAPDGRLGLAGAVTILGRP